jgi:hypothetical protein
MFWSSAAETLALGPPEILVVPLERLHHSGEMLSRLLLQDQLPGLASEGQAPYKFVH